MQTQIGSVTVIPGVDARGDRQAGLNQPCDGHEAEAPLLPAADPSIGSVRLQLGAPVPDDYEQRGAALCLAGLG